MEITRTYDFEVVNKMVRAAFGAPIDQEKFVSNPDNVVLLGEHGAMLYGLTKPGIYSVLSAVMPQGAGKWAADFGRATAEWMFANTDADRLWATVTEDNKRALATMKAALDVEIEQSGPFRVASISRKRWSNRHAVAD
jgi:hypothetical protein